MRFAKFSPELTKAAKFHDRRSKIGLRWDGTERVVLKGIDKSNLRHNVFERDHWQCVDGGPLSLECSGRLELSHQPPMSKSAGSDTMEGTACRCQKHHRILDGHRQPLHFR